MRNHFFKLIGAGIPLEVIGVDVGEASGGTDMTNLVYPTGIEADDLLLIIATTKEFTNDIKTYPTGFSPHFPNPAAENPIIIYYKIATGSESGVITNLSGAQQIGAAIYCIRGADNNSIIDYDYVEVNSNNAVSPSSTSTEADQIHLIGATGNDKGPTEISISGYTFGGRVNNNGSAITYYGTLSSVGATGTVNMGLYNNKGIVWSVIVGAA